jgi:hypothetical protein
MKDVCEDYCWNPRASLRSTGQVLQFEITRKGAAGPIKILNPCNIGCFTVKIGLA